VIPEELVRLTPPTHLDQRCTDVPLTVLEHIMTIILMGFLLLSILTALHTVAKAPRIVRMQTSKLERIQLGKRDHLSVILGNAVSEGLYYVNASVGTPKQSVALQIDTGSSDVWMFGPGACDARTSQCLGGDCKLIPSKTRPSYLHSLSAAYYRI
jgi:hypothetical protein